MKSQARERRRSRPGDESLPMQATPAGRLVSLDIFRGVTIGAMIVVNNLRIWSDTPRFPHLAHSEWNGCTLADLVFPCFIFIVGITSVFSLDKHLKAGVSLLKLYRHIFARTAILFLLGLLACSWFLFGWLFQSICPPAPTTESMWAIFFSPPATPDVYYFSLANLRIPGVLQRIALVYLAVSLLILHTRSRWQLQALVMVGLLLLYWAFMRLPGFHLLPGQDLGAYLDRAIFGENHLWRFTRTWDPEGLLGTMPAIATGLAGALAGYWLKSGYDRLLQVLRASPLRLPGSRRRRPLGAGLPHQQIPLDQFLCGLHRGFRPPVPEPPLLSLRPPPGLALLGPALPVARRQPAVRLCRRPDRRHCPGHPVHRHPRAPHQFRYPDRKLYVR